MITFVYCVLFLFIGFVGGIVFSHKSVEIAQKILTDAQNRLSRANYAWERANEIQAKINAENQKMATRIEEFYGKLGDSILGAKDA